MFLEKNWIENKAASKQLVHSQWQLKIMLHYKSNCVQRLLLVAFLGASLDGCTRNDEQADQHFEPHISPAALEVPVVAFYLERSIQKDQYGDFLGCGVLACSWQNNQRRYFIITAAHVMQNVESSIQIGIMADEKGNTIRRLHVPQGGIEWMQPDINHDVVIGDITKSMDAMKSIGVIIECIDIDSIGANSTIQATNTFSDVGVATSDQYERLSIGPFSHATVVCADIGGTRLMDAATADWSSPFVRKEGTLIATFIQMQLALVDRSGNPISAPISLTVNNYLGEISNGNSGAPVFIRGVDGREYFAGIINGKDGKKFYAIPTDTIRDYVSKVYGGRRQSSIHSYKSVYCAECEARENCVKTVAISPWKPCTRKTNITIEGEAAKRNAFIVFFDNNETLPAPENFAQSRYRIGWDNRKSREATPGHKHATSPSYFGSEGNAINGNTDNIDKLDVENAGLPMNKELNLMRMVSLGKGAANGKMRIEQFTIIEGEPL